VRSSGAFFQRIDQRSIRRIDREGRDGAFHGCLVARHAGDRAARAMPWSSSSATHARASLDRIFAGQNPAGRLGDLLGGLSGLGGQRGKEFSRKEVDVRVGDGEFTPWCLHQVCSSA
jgi:hypothetical protein